LAAQKGRDVLIQIKNGTDFINVGGLRTKGIKINNEPVDVTNSDSEGMRKLLAGAGVNSIEVSGAGVFTDDQGASLVREAAEENTDHPTFRIIFPADTYSRMYEGAFMVANFEQNAEHNNAQMFTATFQSDGEILKTSVED
jgi:TP901-1 family phage major tail protein